MASYHIEWKRSAAKELRKIPSASIVRIVTAVERLSENPYPPGVRKLAGSEQAYRIRVGDYRVIYTVAETLLLIEIIRVGHRKDVYN